MPDNMMASRPDGDVSGIASPCKAIVQRQPVFVLGFQIESDFLFHYTVWQYIKAQNFIPYKIILLAPSTRHIES